MIWRSRSFCVRSASSIAFSVSTSSGNASLGMTESDHSRRHFATVSMRLIHFAAEINDQPSINLVASVSLFPAPHGPAASPALPARASGDTHKSHDDVAAGEEVEVVDPRHPLYGRRYRLISIGK